MMQQQQLHVLHYDVMNVDTGEWCWFVAEILIRQWKNFAK